MKSNPLTDEVRCLWHWAWRAAAECQARSAWSCQRSIYCCWGVRYIVRAKVIHPEPWSQGTHMHSIYIGTTVKAVYDTTMSQVGPTDTKKQNGTNT